MIGVTHLVLLLFRFGAFAESQRFYHNTFHVKEPVTVAPILMIVHEDSPQFVSGHVLQLVPEFVPGLPTRPPTAPYLRVFGESAGTPLVLSKDKMSENLWNREQKRAIINVNKEQQKRG
ncbi:hypothetical protein [Bacilliculturomica massiliensis]|uniref:hypothetical protein n=1 Tax=Bacilliculturomica massiliensis TaxID=1917867 RepID=UPI0010313FEB|nr:hypothetical protein [Bacilliculturomica massiliensis]